MKLGELASILRSKNAGPYITTCDVFFIGRDEYERVEGSGVVTPQRIADLYAITVADVLGVHFYEPALALKVSFLKPVDSGDVFSPDIAGSSQHIPLIDVEIP
jgi:hypothetical protein